jgi:hypothetical protein
MTDQTEIRIDRVQIGEICAEVGDRLRIDSSKRSSPLPSTLLQLIERLDKAGRSEKHSQRFEA